MQRPPPGYQQLPYQQEKKLNLEEMLAKFISVSETHFQNTETLAKLISKRPQGSLPRNIESNLKEQLNAITSQGEEGLVTPEPEPKQETEISKGKGEVDHNEQKPMPNAMKFLNELLANKRKLDEAFNTSKIEGDCLNHSTKTGNMMQPTLQEMSRKARFLTTAGTIIDVGTGELTLCVRDETIILQSRNSSNTSKIEEPHIVTAKPNEEIPLTVLSIFPFGTVEYRLICKPHGKYSHSISIYTMSSLRGKKVIVPALKKRKGASSSSGLTAKIRHPFLQFPIGSQEELFQILQALPLEVGRCIDWATLEQVQLADAIQALLTTDPWGLFFEIVETTYLELTMELCSMFHL
ncbi:hypothetical protein GOBAR_AA00559 [Gossypium barbadense]|uniref:Uncharacterized protein n=1 Tax=Gossypium barbadense TaxID=3634 RepID=A0A2P5YWN7_GOSBA|nr:hypothetical protein GOBAR_AA00559 [Gossypium barbadense]